MQLGMFANLLGCVIFLLIVLFHFVSVNGAGGSIKSQ
jgi:hypothetical protein